MLKMVGHRVLIKPKHVEDQIEDSIRDQESLKKMGFKIAVDSTTQRSLEGGTQIGTVIAIGKMAWKSADLGFGLPGWREWCKEGDEVVYAKYAGKPLTDPALTGDEAKFVVINDVDVQAITKEA